VKLPKDKVQEVAEILMGTTMSVEAAAGKAGLDEDDYQDDADALDQLIDYVERCEGCEWWCEPGELADDDDDLCGLCDDCKKDQRPKDEEE